MPHPTAQKNHIDSELICTVIFAGVHGIPVDPQQLCYEFSSTDEPFSDQDILRAAKLQGLKARRGIQHRRPPH